jgi:uncharacterized protein with FMN-binding domain
MRRAVLAILSTIVGLVLLLTFKTESLSATTPPAAIGSNGNISSGSSGTGSPGSSGSSGSSGSAGSAGSAGSTSGSAGSSGGSASKTVTGEAADTRYGPVQVQITVTDGKVSAVQAVEYPQNDPRDEEINSYAIPQLNAEATSAGNAQIDMVSGATYTSEGYVQSLQSALDKAGL